jgi:hypothetical protein
MPWRVRSSGTYPIPASRRASVLARVMSVPDSVIGAGGAPAQTHDRLDELGLPVALDAGDAQHLAGPHDEVDALEQGPAPLPVPGVVGGELQPGDAQHLPVGDRGVAGLRAGQLGADHHLGELAGGHGARVGRADAGAPADHGDRVGDGPDLVELVGDEDERVALGAHAAQRAEQVVDLLRHEDGRRLVEDDRAGAAVEHLDDLDALPVGHAQALDERVGAHVQADGAGQLGDPGLRRAADPVQRLGAQQDVLGHGQVVGEHEVLVHHADPGLDRVGGRAEAHELAVDGDRALVRRLDPVEDLHQRGLAGTVLPAQGVHLAAAHPQVDVAVGDDPGEPLRDAGELDGVLTLGHVPPSRTTGGRGLIGPGPPRTP